MNIIVIANGVFPTLPPVLRCLGQSDAVVCCDGALEKYLRWYRQQSPRPTCPVAVVGDGDSLSPALLNEAKNAGINLTHQQVDEQEYNDLTKAVRYAMGLGPVERVTILGATGKREDHTLGNISLLAYYQEMYAHVQFTMPTDYGTFYPMQGRGVFASHEGQQVSLFSLTPSVPITVKGLRYPIDNRCLTQWWQGTLNEAEGDNFEVTGGQLIVYLKH